MLNKTVFKRFCIITLVLLFTAGGVAEAATFGSRNIFIGTRGEDVMELQDFLNENGYREGQVDGVYGPLTLASLMRFQENNDLSVDGIAGGETLELIMDMQSVEEKVTTMVAADEKVTMAVAADEFNFSAADMDLFARIVHAEAEGENFAGQVAVAATILNRIRSEIYPNTMSGVVYHVESGKYQYSPVLDGRINRPAGESAKKAALQALNGQDPTLGATGFYNPAKTSNQWVRSRPVTTSIGSHVFFK